MIHNDKSNFAETCDKNKKSNAKIGALPYIH
jgi:hypothetical protein